MQIRTGGGHTMTRLHYLYVLAGAVVFLILHIHFVIAWESLYAQHPWTGYNPGASPAFFSSSPRSVALANVVLFATALALTMIPPGQRPRIGVALWAGVMGAVVLVWLATARLRQEDRIREQRQQSDAHDPQGNIAAAAQEIEAQRQHGREQHTQLVGVLKDAGRLQALDND